MSEIWAQMGLGNLGESSPSLSLGQDCGLRSLNAIP